MQFLIKFMAVSVIVCGGLVIADSAFSATRLNRTTLGETAMGRMPSIPSLPGFTLSPDTQDVPDSKPSTPPNSGTPSEPSDPKPNDPKPDDPKPDDPTPPSAECPDGGVRDSLYTVEDCMNDLLLCINTGGLPDGLMDMFDEDVRNAIVTGMQELCQPHVNRCIAEVRQDCEPVYRGVSDVWLDFNTRKVQPAYNDFVLRKTGLTPNQAKTVCLLLDRNTYGPSLAAVAAAANGKTTEEYNKKVGAYNSQLNNSLSKANPQGPIVNNFSGTVDGARGHYARWDAKTADCYLRIGAYNKDTQITNTWLFGAAGDNRPAEAWRPAGDTFVCNKDLFGFDLKTKTKTAALVGIGGGAALGSAVGAAVGHGKSATIDCSKERHRKVLQEQIAADTTFATTLNSSLGTTFFSDKNASISERECNLLKSKYYEWNADYKNCVNKYVTQINASCEVKSTNSTDDDSDKAKLCAELVKCVKDNSDNDTAIETCIKKALKGHSDDSGQNVVAKIFGNVKNYDVCDGDLARVWNGLPILTGGEDSTMLENTLGGMAVGTGTGALATAITALLERNNINCRVGDGLVRVGMGKSYTIETLRDFYVKWNLKLPDTIGPIANVNSCQTWEWACQQYTDMEECPKVQILYSRGKDFVPISIPAACVRSGSACIVNEAVAISYGVCKQE